MPFGPSTVAVDEVHNRIYVGNAIARSLTIVDGATLRVARTLALPIAPVALHVDSSLSPARIFALATDNEGGTGEYTGAIRNGTCSGTVTFTDPANPNSGGPLVYGKLAPERRASVPRRHDFGPPFTIASSRH